MTTGRVPDYPEMGTCPDCGMLAAYGTEGVGRWALTRHLAPCGAFCHFASSRPDTYSGDRKELHCAPMRAPSGEVVVAGSCSRCLMGGN